MSFYEGCDYERHVFDVLLTGTIISLKHTLFYRPAKTSYSLVFGYLAYAKAVYSAQILTKLQLRVKLSRVNRVGLLMLTGLTENKAN